MYRMFFEEYDPDGDLSFLNVKFRNGAEHTLDFGLYLKEENDIVPTFGSVALWFRDGRLVYDHIGDDRGDPTHTRIYNPFTCYMKWYDPSDGGNAERYGGCLVGKPISADFLFRIGHPFVYPKILEMIKKKELIPAGIVLGEIGSKGTGTGKHSHFEIVSLGKRSEICDYILEKKGLINSPDLIGPILKSNVSEKTKDWLRYKIMQPKGIEEFSSVCVERYNGFRDDFHPSIRITHYDSRAIFGM